MHFKLRASECLQRFAEDFRNRSTFDRFLASSSKSHVQADEETYLSQNNPFLRGLSLGIISVKRSRNGEAINSYTTVYNSVSCPVCSYAWVSLAMSYMSDSPSEISSKYTKMATGENFCRMSLALLASVCLSNWLYPCSFRKIMFESWMPLKLDLWATQEFHCSLPSELLPELLREIMAY